MFETLRKLVWAFEFWNGDVSFKIIRCKICWKAWVRECFDSNFWEERGEKLMTCHLFLDNFSWNFMTFCFSKVKSFETDFCFKKTQISRCWYHEMFMFSESCLLTKDVLLQKIDCAFVLAIRGLLHMIKNFVLWCDFYVKSLLRNPFFWKVFLKKTLSWRCRKHVFVFEIVSLKDLDKFMIKLSFSCDFFW